MIPPARTPVAIVRFHWTICPLASVATCVYPLGVNVPVCRPSAMVSWNPGRVLTSCRARFGPRGESNVNVAETKSVGRYDVYGLVGAGVVQSTSPGPGTAGPHEKRVNGFPV